MAARGRKIQRTQFATGVKASLAKGWQPKTGQSALVGAQLFHPPIGIGNRPKIHSGIVGA